MPSANQCLICGLTDKLEHFATPFLCKPCYQALTAEETAAIKRISRSTIPHAIIGLISIGLFFGLIGYDLSLKNDNFTIEGFAFGIMIGASILNSVGSIKKQKKYKLFASNLALDENRRMAIIASRTLEEKTLGKIERPKIGTTSVVLAVAGMIMLFVMAFYPVFFIPRVPPSVAMSEFVFVFIGLFFNAGGVALGLIGMYKDKDKGVGLVGIIYNGFFLGIYLLLIIFGKIPFTSQ